MAAQSPAVCSACVHRTGFVMLVLEGHAQGFQIWGNVPDTTATGLAWPGFTYAEFLSVMRPGAIDWAG